MELLEALPAWLDVIFYNHNFYETKLISRQFLLFSLDFSRSLKKRSGHDGIQREFIFSFLSKSDLNLIYDFPSVELQW